MADSREPPPFEVDEGDAKKDDDDLFSDASEHQKTDSVGETKKEAEPVKKTVPVFVSLNDHEDEDDDLFAEEDVVLDSDENEEDQTITEKYIPKLEEPKKKEPTVAESLAAVPPEAIRPLSAEEERPKLPVSQSSTSSSKITSSTKNAEERNEGEDDQYSLEIMVTEPMKVGDGMGAYIVYKVMTKTNVPAFRRNDMCVPRRFSDFLGLHEKLSEKHVHQGCIVPPAPEKSVLGMTKVKMSKEESGSADFVEKRRAALERFLKRTAAHPVLRMDPDFREFLERDGELPKSTSTSALSGAGVKRLLSRVGDAVEKISFKMDENDEWFEDRHQQIENLDQQLRKLHSSMEALSQHRKELSQTTAVFAKSAAMLANAEEHTALSRALSQLAETEEKIEQLHKEQSDQDYFTMAELLKDYIVLIGAVKDVLHERVKVYKTWKDAEATLTKKRETKVKLELSHKTDKISQAQQEITEWNHKVEKGQADFERISATIKKEVARFDRLRVEDFKKSVITYLEHLMENEQKLIKYWEAFLPEGKAII
ncbi:hypothetical protein CHS0354_022292 [Potamilus streckersoni]|uniref:Sorting nexin-2 n=1 Tax=Potamilus streckersoni TaxID=2493646 RepID=A0AAE0TH24_9BIVA|nr:hypothetical protein CHS0354_022292 [Potamilus streckersoni]